MSAPLRATNEQIINAYKATGSVWKAAMRLGLCGQSVHERLLRLGVVMACPNWTEEEVEVASQLATDGYPIPLIARRLGRTYAAIACKLSELGIKSPHRTPKKVKRGIGFNKQNVLKFAKFLLKSGLSVTKAARRKGVSTTSLVNALQQYAPMYWEAYKRNHVVLPNRICEACSREFTPLNARQKCCDGRCSAHARSDKAYFGGKRQGAIGLSSGVCQLCEKHTPKHLAAHHVFGKENDPDNDFLVALCRGCHQLVGSLGRRSDVKDAYFWENLISLVLMRAWSDRGRRPLGTHICVDIQELGESEVEEMQLQEESI